MAARAAAAGITMAASIVLLELVLVQPIAAGNGATTAGRCDPKRDVVVNQDAGHRQSNGAKKYNVEVSNNAGVPVSGIHLYCGYNFHTVTSVDPSIIVLVTHGDCLLLGGGALAPGGSVSFNYTSYTRYELNLIAATCDDGP